MIKKAALLVSRLRFVPGADLFWSCSHHPKYRLERVWPSGQLLVFFLAILLKC